MEFLTILLALIAGYLVFKKPEKEKLAFSILVIGVLLMASLFLFGSRGSILPPFNY